MQFNNRSTFEELLRKVNLNPGAFYAPFSDDDPGKNLEDEIKRRDKDYTELLDNYVSITSIRNRVKEVHKWVFFWLIIVACIFGMRYSYKILNRVLAIDDVKYLIECIPLVISGIVSFVSTIIAIPLTIAKFLFNTQEDDNITNVITHTQDHDTSALTLFKERFSKKDSSNESNKPVTPPQLPVGNIDSDFG